MPTFHSRGALSAAIAAALAGALTSAGPAQAQIALDTIVVEGTSLDFTPEPVSDAPSAVTVVTGAQLEAQQIRHAGDALRSLPGVHVSRNGGFAGLTEVRLRGAESNHVLVLIDGVEANATTNGLFSFSDLAVENIERIEVIRGPQSGLFGSSALAGVINIVTRARRGPLQITARQENGSFDGNDTAATLSGGTDFYYGSLSLVRRTSNGFNIAPVGFEEDFSEHQSAFFKGGVKPAKNLSLDFMVRHVDKKGGRDTEGGPGPLAVQVDAPSTFGTDILLASAAATWSIFDGRWVHKFRADTNETAREDTDVSGFGTFSSLNDSKSRRLQYLSTVNLESPKFARAKHRITAMAERELETFNPVTADNITREREAKSLALDYHGEFLKHLTLHAAVRRDDNDTVIDFITYRLAGSLRVPRTPLRLHASVGTGVKLPTMFEQFGVIPALFVPNPGLVPEESLGWDAGAELSLFKGRAVVDVTWFEANLENEITTVFLPGFLSTPENLPGASRREGVEVAVRLRPAKALDVALSYTHLNATEPSGRVEIRRPEHSARADINYRFARDRANLNARIAYNGEMQDQAFVLPFFDVTRVTLDDYLLVALTGSYKVRPRMELFGRVENLLNEDYQEIFGFETPGLTAFAGLKVRLGGDPAR